MIKKTKINITRTISMEMKSELTNEKIKPRKLTNTNRNCKNVEKIILLSKISLFFKFLIDNKMIKKEKQSPKIKE